MLKVPTRSNASTPGIATQFIWTNPRHLLISFGAEYENLLPAARYQKRPLYPFPIKLKEAIKARFRKTRRLRPAPWIGQILGGKRNQPVVAGGQIPDRLRDDDLNIGGFEHALDNAAGIGQEVIKARLHDDIIGVRQRFVPSHIPHDAVASRSANASNEYRIEIEPAIAHGFMDKMAREQCSRAAADVEDVRSIRDEIGNNATARAIVAPVKEPHDQFVSEAAAIYRACLQLPSPPRWWMYYMTDSSD